MIHNSDFLLIHVVEIQTGFFRKSIEALHGMNGLMDIV